jgi:hypothetical protein
MMTRIQPLLDLYRKAVELRSKMEDLFQALHQSDGSGGFFLVSSNSIGQDLIIETVLACQNEVNLRYEMSIAESRGILDEYIAGRVVIGKAGRQRIARIFKNLKESIDLRGTSFYHVRFVP